MKQARTFLIVLVIALPLSAAAQSKYIGINSCKPCHKGEKKSMVYEKWLKSKHASAFKTLQTPEAAKVARKEGVKGKPDEASACLKCHITAYGVKEDLLAKKYDKTEGITCEACHGPGSSYKTAHSKKGATEEDAKKAGLKMPEDDAKLCTACHNKTSPTYKPFDYKKDWGEIAHPVKEG